jgi:UDP-2,3-diacylglucosamine pyrophosphatase LpxH
MRRPSHALVFAIFLGAMNWSIPTGIATSAASSPTTSSPATSDPGMFVFISDLHFAIGKQQDGSTSPLEDFRWSRALEGFLDAISREGQDRVTLVIAGDLLELWQHPAVPCLGNGPDLGCSTVEMDSIADTAIKSHSDDLAALGRFADRGNNQLVLIPGNHDAAILIPSVWQKLQAKIAAKKHPAILATTGIWSSGDGQIVAEHGHQIGEDPNQYKTWPNILSPDGQHLIRNWGEYWVQEQFNHAEPNYPLVDNLIPQSAGLRYYMADRGISGSAADIAKFFYFNIIETSFSQKISLGAPTNSGTNTLGSATNNPWDLDDARNRLGYKLLAYSLPANDILRKKLLAPPDSSWAGMQGSLNQAAKELPNERVAAICGYLASTEGLQVGEEDRCKSSALGAAIVESALLDETQVLTTHLNKRFANYPKMTMFIYGHTHQMQNLGVIDGVFVFNTGAFQRLVDDNMFRYMANLRSLTPGQALNRIPLEELPACYSAVVVKYVGNSPRGTLRNWKMSESDASGTFVGECDPACARISNTCTAN